MGFGGFGRADTSIEVWRDEKVEGETPLSKCIVGRGVSVLEELSRRRRGCFDVGETVSLVGEAVSLSEKLFHCRRSCFIVGGAVSLSEELSNPRRSPVSSVSSCSTSRSPVTSSVFSSSCSSVRLLVFPFLFFRSISFSCPSVPSFRLSISPFCLPASTPRLSLPPLPVPLSLLSISARRTVVGNTSNTSIEVGGSSL